MKALSKRKTSFWTAIFWCPEEMPHVTIEEFSLTNYSGEMVEIMGRKEMVEKLAQNKLRELNAEMMHPENKMWRYKLVELKGGKR